MICAERSLGKRAVVGLLGGLCALGVAEAPAGADGLPGFKKDMRPVRSRNKVDASLYYDGPENLKYASGRPCSVCVRGSCRRPGQLLHPIHAVFASCGLAN